MSDNPHHVHLLKELEEQLQPVLSNSPQSIYLYLDDIHKTCNEKFAKMLGYKNPQEWIANEFPIADVAEEDQKKGIEAYGNASEKFIASSFEGTWVKKDGTKIKTDVIMVPISYENEVFVLHFITEKKQN